MIDPINDGLADLTPIDSSIFDRFNDQTHTLFIVCMIPRSGGAQFFSHLEHTYYPPGTPANDDFQMMFHHWEGRPWIIGSIPLRDRAKADASAAATKMRLADGYPMIVDYPWAGPGVVGQINVREEKVRGRFTIRSRFPLHSRRTFTLENQHVGTGPVMSGVMIGEQPLDDFWRSLLRSQNEMNADIRHRRAQSN